MGSTVDARRLIESIAANNGVFSADVQVKAKDDPLVAALLQSAENLKQIAANATQKLGEDLYSDDIRFVLECLQNADDNTYAADVEPFLQFSIHPEKISIACNEQGFTDADVKALCSVGKSTKTQATTSSGHVRYIGAKGIGFKSVFKVAQKVYVRSPPFSFMFDKKVFLGMITPLWVEHTPLSETPDSPQTQILLLPPVDRERYTDLFEDFRSIHPTILLFLRNLKKIEVNIHDHDGEDAIPSTRLFSSQFSDDGKVATLTTQTNNSVSEQKYHLSKSFKDDMPREAQRMGISRSEIILGFSVDDKGRPHEAIESVHAFLPVREFGFKFLIQADFMLTSNRQDLDEKVSWNIALRNAIPGAFCDAVLQFMTSDQHKVLRYSWVRYLPDNISAEFWRPLQQGILKLMQSTAAIETQNAILKIPSDVHFENPDFWDQNSKLLVGDDDDFISSNYYKQDFPALMRLGVKTATWEWFIAAFKKLPDHSLDSKGLPWHTGIAKVIFGMPDRLWGVHKEAFKKKALIPLRGGAWIAISEEETGVFFQSNGVDNDTKVPEDITLNLVENTASACKHRKKFFQKLGVKDLDVHAVANLILAQHQDRENPRPSLAQAIAHIKYLYKAQFPAKPGFEELWLYDHLGRPSKGWNLYLDDGSVEFGAARLLKEASKITVKFLHPGYTKNLSEGERRRFGAWLTGLTQISNTPRLLKSDGNFTPEFVAIMSQGSDIFLKTLRYNWTQYAKVVKDDIEEYLSDKQVMCASLDGSREYCALKDCFVPDTELCKISADICAGAEMPFLDLPRPLVKGQWKFLAKLGVGFEKGLSFYFWILKQKKFREICTLEISKALYLRIAEVPGNHDAETLLQGFTIDSGIFVPGEKLWYTPNQCVWDSPDGFSSLASLKPFYSSNRKIEMLFQDLEIKDATINQVLSDLKSRLQRDQLGSKEVLEACKYLLNKMPDQRPGNINERDASAIRDTFAMNSLLPISSEPESKTATIAECLWSAPDSMHSKFVLQKAYVLDLEMEKFIRAVLKIPNATTDDLLEELLLLKNIQPETNMDVNSLYEYWSLNLPTIPDVKEIRQQFEEQALVLVPNDDGSFQWKRSSECIWSNTTFKLQSKTCLSPFYSKNAHLSHFFHEILNIKDASLSDYLEELQYLQKCKIFDVQRTKDIYSKIQQLMGPKKTSSEMKIFESTPLILVPVENDPQWVYPTDCIWTSTNFVLSKISLADEYGNFKRLFCSRLSIGDATPSMLVAELIKLGREDEPIKPETLKRAKDLLLGLNSFVEGFGDDSRFEPPLIEQLLQERCWPCINHLDRSVHFLSYVDPFFIADRTHLSKMFSNRVPTLALIHEETLSIMDFLLHIGMQGKLMSNSTAETTDVAGKTELCRRLTTNLRSRAHELFRCAIYFNSNRSEEETQHLQLMLNGVIVRTGSRIDANHTLEGQGIKLDYTDEGVMHLREEESKLIIYVCNNADEQEFAWLSLLPQKLCDFLNIDVEKAGLIVANILNLKSGYLDKFLDPLGIPGRVKSSASLSRHSIDGTRPPSDGVDGSDAGIRDVAESTVSRRRTRSKSSVTIYVDSEDYKPTNNKSQIVIESDDDESMFVPQSLRSSVQTAKYPKDEKPIIKGEVFDLDFDLDDLYGPPSPGARRRKSKSPSSGSSSEAQPADPTSLGSNEGLSKVIPVKSEPMSSKKRKAAVHEDEKEHAKKRTTDLSRGFADAVKTSQGEHLGIGVASTQSASSQKIDSKQETKQKQTLPSDKPTTS